MASRAASFAAAAASAGSLLQYEMDGQPGDQLFTAPTFSAPGTTGMNLTRGPGLTSSVGSNSMNSSGWVGPAADDYYSFGFSVGPGTTALTLMLCGPSSAAPARVRPRIPDLAEA